MSTSTSKVLKQIVQLAKHNIESRMTAALQDPNNNKREVFAVFRTLRCWENVGYNGYMDQREELLGFLKEVVVTGESSYENPFGEDDTEQNIEQFMELSVPHRKIFYSLAQQDFKENNANCFKFKMAVLDAIYPSSELSDAKSDDHKQDQDLPPPKRRKVDTAESSEDTAATKAKVLKTASVSASSSSSKNNETSDEVAVVNNKIASAKSVRVVQYSAKCVAVFGDTKPFKDRLMELGGRFKGNLKENGARSRGWNFKNDLKEQLEKLFTSDVTSTSKDTSPEAARDCAPTTSTSDTPDKVEPMTKSTTSDNVRVVQYTAKCVAAFGDTKPFKDRFMQLGGRFNRKLKENGKRSPGWIFKNDMKEKLQKLLI